MSRTPISARRPGRGGTFRPQLEALEDRLAPVPLGGPPGLGPGDPSDLGAHLAFLAGLQTGSPQAPIVTTSPVLDFATRSIVFGESTLIRTDHGVTARLHASGLQPGVYTFWMAVDLPGVPTAAGRLAGHVVGESGIADFAGHVNVGDIVGNPSIPGREGTLQDPLHSTITLVVRAHGPADPGRIHEQTHSFEAGVAVNFLISIHAPPP